MFQIFLKAIQKKVNLFNVKLGGENTFFFLSVYILFHYTYFITVWWRLKAERGKESAKKETKYVCKNIH